MVADIPVTLNEWPVDMSADLANTIINGLLPIWAGWGRPHISDTYKNLQMQVADDDSRPLQVQTSSGAYFATIYFLFEATFH